MAALRAQGLTHKQIADRFGVAYQAVSRALARRVKQEAAHAG